MLAENDDELVRRTLRALQATGDELVGLTPRWRRAIGLRAGFSARHRGAAAAHVLTFARIRPVGREVAKRLVALAAAGALGRIVDARMEDQWELWDVLNLLHAAGYDVTRLWRADPASPRRCARCVRPEEFRLYSIASATPRGRPPRDAAAGGRRAGLHLGAHALLLRRRRARHARRTSCAGWPPSRATAASSCRCGSWRRPGSGCRPTRRPSVMFAAGSGVAPFHGFVAARLRGPGRPPDRLYLGLRRPEEFVEHRLERAAPPDGWPCTPRSPGPTPPPASTPGRPSRAGGRAGSTT